MSFGPMNISKHTKNRLKIENFPNFGYIWAIRSINEPEEQHPLKNGNLTLVQLENGMKNLGLLYCMNNFFPSHWSLGDLNTYPSEQLVSYVIPRERSVVIVQYQAEKR